MKITYLQYNWHQYQDKTDAGENFSSFTLGKNCENIEKISETIFRVTLSEREQTIIYNPNLIHISK